MLVGLAVGDALGAAIEFAAPGTFFPVTEYRGGGPHGLGPGEWTDDTAMALALADSIAEVGWDLNDQADRYCDWWQRGAFECVLVYRVDRIARNTLELLRCVEALERHGVTLRSMSEPFETDTSVGKFVLTMLGSVAQLDRDAIRERCMLGKARKAREGKWVCGTPPLGYRVGPDSRLEVDEDEARIVRQIFRWYVEDGLGTIGIADALTAQGVPVTSLARGENRPGCSGRWQAGQVARILQNSSYAGRHEWPRRKSANGARAAVGAGEDPEVIVQAVPPIVDEAMFDAARQQAKRNFAMARRNARRAYLLRGLVVCGRCGRAYMGDGQHGQNRFYYRCTGTSSFRGALVPKYGAAYLRAEVLEDLVWQDIAAFLRSPGVVLEQVAANLRAQVEAQAPVEEEQAGVEAALRAKQVERQKVIGMTRRSIISEREAETELALLQREVNGLEERLSQLFDRRARLLSLEARLLTAGAVLEQLRGAVDVAAEAARRAAIEALVYGTTVTTVEENGERIPHVSITYCFDEQQETPECSTRLPMALKPA